MRPASWASCSSRKLAGRTLRATCVPVIRAMSCGCMGLARPRRLTTVRVSSALRMRSRSHMRTMRLTARTAMTSGVVTSRAVSAISMAAALALFMWEPQSTMTTP